MTVKDCDSDHIVVDIIKFFQEKILIIWILEMTRLGHFLEIYHCIAYEFFNGPIPASFFIFYSCHNSNIKWEKRRWWAWDSNLGQQDGRRRRILWAMAAPQFLEFLWLEKLLYYDFRVIPYDRRWGFIRLATDLLQRSYLRSLRYLRLD